MKTRWVKKGVSDFVEFPVQVAGTFRLPFFATFHLSCPSFIVSGYRSIKEESHINYQMHLSDFVDYTEPHFESEIPHQAGSYLPLSLTMKLNYKMRIWENVFNHLKSEFSFIPLQEVLNRL